MKKAYLTVYLSLSLGVILSLILALTEAARVNAIRMQIECVADTACNSVLAEYHRQLLEQYELFYVDTSYGTANAVYANTEAHLKSYMEHNFSLQDVSVLRSYRDVLQLSAEDVSLLSAAIATDEQGIGLKRQAVLYMKDKVGLSLAEELMKNVQIVTQYEQESANLQKQRQDVEEQLNEMIHEKEESLPPEKRTIETDDGTEEIEVQPEITRDNPADIVNAARGLSILRLVIKDANSISYQKITPSNYVTGRQLHVGSGRQEGMSYPDSFFENVVFYEYILEKCGKYTEVLDKSLLKYQTEYIICGKDSDDKNLEAIMNRLLLLREAANVLYLMSDSTKMAEIQALSTTLTLICMVPEAEPLVRYSIMFAWAYVESIRDVRVLFNGGKVPLMKTNGTWGTGLLKMTQFQGNYETGGGSEGLSYEDYLRIFLCLTDEDKVTMRLMDIMEMDIRQTAGNENFRMDACTDYFEMLAGVRSEYGYNFTIQRKYGYEPVG